jgi:hypothetical protein
MVQVLPRQACIEIPAASDREPEANSAKSVLVFVRVAKTRRTTLQHPHGFVGRKPSHLKPPGSVCPQFSALRTAGLRVRGVLAMQLRKLQLYFYKSSGVVSGQTATSELCEIGVRMRCGAGPRARGHSVLAVAPRGERHRISSSPAIQARRYTGTLRQVKDTLRAKTGSSNVSKYGAPMRNELLYFRRSENIHTLRRIEGVSAARAIALCVEPFGAGHVRRES